MSPPRAPLFVARTVVLLVAIAAVAMMAASGPGTRLEFWSWQTGIAILRAGTYTGLAAILGALMLLLAMLVPRLRSRPWMPAIALVLGLVAALPPLTMLQKAKAVPRIHDISTDLADPPVFVALAAVRKASPNGLEHGGPAVAEQQRLGYPDIRTSVLEWAPNEAMQRSIDAARALGWEIAASDTGAGRLEATHTTAFFGFKDDIVVRIRPEGTGSRIDVRSVSRVGLSDLGANADRIRRFLGKLA